LIGEAVFARTLSSMKGERVEASKAFPRIKAHFKSDTEKMIVDLEQALYASNLYHMRKDIY